MGGCGCEKERELRGQEWSEGSCESWEWPGGGDVFVDENGCWDMGPLFAITNFVPNTESEINDPIIQGII